MKKEYIAPEMDVVKFAAEEEITLSGSLFETLLGGDKP